MHNTYRLGCLKTGEFSLGEIFNKLVTALAVVCHRRNQTVLYSKRYY